MAGGIKAWQGGVASGAPEAGMAHFAAAVTVAEMVALAWGLEEGTRRFYQEMAARSSDDRDTAALFGRLAEDEVLHKQMLEEAYGDVAGRDADLTAMVRQLGPRAAGETIEGGILLEQVLAWAETQGEAGILEMAMALEVNALDLYLKMGHRADNEASRDFFKRLARGEQGHLQRLGERLDGALAKG